MLTLITLLAIIELTLVVAAIWRLARPTTETAPQPATGIGRATLLASSVAAAVTVVAAPTLIKVEPKPTVNVPIAVEHPLQPNRSVPEAIMIDEQTGTRVRVPLDIPPKRRGYLHG